MTEKSDSQTPDANHDESLRSKNRRRPNRPDHREPRPSLKRLGNGEVQLVARFEREAPPPARAKT